MGSIVSRKLKVFIALAIGMALTTYLAYNALHGVSNAFDGAHIEWDE